jgi:hypothetical protein
MIFPEDLIRRTRFLPEAIFIRLVTAAATQWSDATTCPERCDSRIGRQGYPLSGQVLLSMLKLSWVVSPTPSSVVRADRR